MNLDVLNERQKEAVEYSDGPTLVVAGAGSGKTRVLTYKIAHLIESGVLASSILAITFTNKAAKEMKHRVVEMLGASAFASTITTFHSFGARILRSDIEVLGYNKNFTILDSNDQNIIVKQILNEMNVDIKMVTPRSLVGKISSFKNSNIGIKEAALLADSEYEERAAKVYEKYVERLKINNCVDFDDLLILPIELFKKSPETLAKYQEFYKYILVDEYQDTNSLQYNLVRMLGRNHQNIFVVGDGDQSIYSWRGANVENILNFEKDYNNAKVILLEENYRSTKTIIQAANEVIRNNKYRKEKNLFTNNDEGELIKYTRCNDEHEEVEHIISEVIKLKRKGVRLQDMAILYRTNAQSRVFEEKLLRENITYNIIGSYYFYARKEIKDIIAYLKLLVNFDDNISFERVVNEPKRGIGNTTVETLRNISYSNGISMFNAISMNYLSSSANVKLNAFRQLMDNMCEYSLNHSITKLIRYILEETGYNKMLQEKNVENNLKQEYLEEFLSVAKEYEETHEEFSVEDFLEQISLVADMNQYQEIEEKLTLMTLHSAKGLEYEYVFLAGMDEDIFPHKNSQNTAMELEEERRLCYVGITRAKKQLYLSSASSRLFHGQRNIYRASRFISEIDSSLIEGETEVVATKKIVSKEINSEDAQFNIGDNVIHHLYGEGVITVLDDDLIGAAFAHPHGLKKFSKSFNSLKVI